MYNYNLARHPSFDKIIQEIGKNNEKAEKTIATAIEKLLTEPYKVGKPLKGAPPDLQGKIWRIWVGGKKGFRIFYSIDKKKKTVVLLDIQLRADIDYDSLFDIREWNKFRELLNAIEY